MGFLIGLIWTFILYGVISGIWITYEIWRCGKATPSLFHDLIAIALAFLIYLALFN